MSKSSRRNAANAAVVPSVAVAEAANAALVAPVAESAPKAKAKAIKASIIKATKEAKQAEATKAVEPTKAVKAPKPPALKGDAEAAHAEIRELVAAESARRLCLCGCGAQTPKAFFVPGHDAKLLSAMLKADVARQVAAGVAAVPAAKVA
jgi:hypothetical protein